jgi:hypothetical protein
MLDRLRIGGFLLPSVLITRRLLRRILHHVNAVTRNTDRASRLVAAKLASVEELVNEAPTDPQKVGRLIDGQNILARRRQGRCRWRGVLRSRQRLLRPLVGSSLLFGQSRQPRIGESRGQPRGCRPGDGVMRSTQRRVASRSRPGVPGLLSGRPGRRRRPGQSWLAPGPRRRGERRPAPGAAVEHLGRRSRSMASRSTPLAAAASASCSAREIAVEIVFIAARNHGRNGTTFPVSSPRRDSPWRLPRKSSLSFRGSVALH